MAKVAAFAFLLSLASCTSRPIVVGSLSCDPGQTMWIYTSTATGPTLTCAARGRPGWRAVGVER